MPLRFLTIADVLLLHEDQVAGYGGKAGMRDQGLLESALSQPFASFDGQQLHTDVYEIVAVYLFHVVQNHPFVDGNKRTGLVAALTFLVDNGIEIDAAKGELYDLTMRVATGVAKKPEVAQFFRSHLT
jgi:death-on-curing protein